MAMNRRLLLAPLTLSLCLALHSQTLIGPASSSFGDAVAACGDVDGDGFGDFLVGAPGYDDGFTDEGRAALYSGASSGVVTLPAWTVDGGQAGAALGTSVGIAGDVNGDGYSDVIVGLPSHDGTFVDEGAAWLFLGSASGPASSPDWQVAGGQAECAFGSAVYTAGDVNGDGYSDVVVGAPLFDDGAVDEGAVFLYYGSPTGPAVTPARVLTGGQAGAHFGHAAATAGDVDGDQFDDLLVGAPLFDTSFSNAGRAFLFLGSPSGPGTTPSWTASGDFTDVEYGFAVHTGGDVNLDGYCDLVIGVPGGGYFGRAGYTRAGRAHVFHGGPSGPGGSSDWEEGGPKLGARFGESVCTAGDLNGDGYDDVVVGAPDHQLGGLLQTGRTHAYLGSPKGLHNSETEFDFGTIASGLLGASMATAGDLNDDGYSDWIAGAPGLDEVRVYLGAPRRLPPTASAQDILRGNLSNMRLGAAVACAGDLNGDGYDELVAGAPDYDNGVAGGGLIVLFHGPVVLPSLGQSLFVPNADWSLVGDQVDAHFGRAFATAGDVNGDGFDDFLVGLREYDTTAVDAGRALLFLGSPSGIGASPDWSLDGTQPGELLGSSVASAGDATIAVTCCPNRLFGVPVTTTS